MALTFGAMAAVWAILLTRRGLLAFVAAMFSSYLLDGFPITANLSAWYSGASLIAMAAILAVGIYGFYTSSLACRSVFQDILPEEI